MNAFDQEIMARTAIGEARGEMIEGMQAVMWSGMNRFNAKGKWFSMPSIAGTFLKYKQYDCWMPNDQNYSIISNLTVNSGLLISALKWASGVIDGTIPDPTDGATHYYADSIDSPDWVIGATKTVQIGRHIFFKDVS